MAASYVRALGTTLRGVGLVGGRWLRTPVLPCQCPRLANVPPVAYMCTGSRTDAQNSSRTEDRKTRKEQEQEEEEEEEEEEEYVPRKPKNPMVTVGFAWMIGLPTGIIGFMLTKREVDKNRLKQLKVRQRMSRSNDGEYEGSRYHRHTEAVER